MMESKFHTFAQPIQSIPLPERFTYPFHYTPHPLCVIAAEETQAYLKERTEWREELQTGKMFGVWWFVLPPERSAIWLRSPVT